jgi:hypothetical protein
MALRPKSGLIEAVTGSRTMSAFDNTTPLLGIVARLATASFALRLMTALALTGLVALLLLLAEQRVASRVAADTLVKCVMVAIAAEWHDHEFKRARLGPARISTPTTAGIPATRSQDASRISR